MDLPCWVLEDEDTGGKGIWQMIADWWAEQAPYASAEPLASQPGEK